jgi:patatin-like phospholipase/acyl hydrolase
VIGDMFQILTLDGGRLRGIFSAATLTASEEDLRISTVDLIAGTSTGGSSRWAWAWAGGHGRS